jgi:hypothetical protein
LTFFFTKCCNSSYSSTSCWVGTSERVASKSGCFWASCLSQPARVCLATPNVRAIEVARFSRTVRWTQMQSLSQVQVT